MTKASNKRIQFGENEIHEIDADEYGEENWMDAGEMKQSFRADVVAFLAAYKKGQEEQAEEDEEEIEPVCSRGLEMYFPGELKQRRKLKKIIVANILKKAHDTRCFFHDPSEAAEHLERFTSSLTMTSRKRAIATALQDAVEARLVYSEGLELGSTKMPSALEYVRMIKLESRAEPVTSKARAA